MAWCQGHINNGSPQPPDRLDHRLGNRMECRLPRPVPAVSFDRRATGVCQHPRGGQPLHHPWGLPQHQQCLLKVVPQHSSSSPLVRLRHRPASGRPNSSSLYRLSRPEQEVMERYLSEPHSPVHNARAFIAVCAVCAHGKSSHQPLAVLLNPLPIPQQLWPHIMIDFVMDCHLRRDIR